MIVKSKTPLCNRHKKYHDNGLSLKFPLFIDLIHLGWKLSCLWHRPNHELIGIKEKTQYQKRLFIASRWLARWSSQCQGIARNEYKVRLSVQEQDWALDINMWQIFETGKLEYSNRKKIELLDWGCKVEIWARGKSNTKFLDLKTTLTWSLTYTQCRRLIDLRSLNTSV